MLEPLIKSSYSIIEVLKKLNMSDHGGNRYTIKKKAKKFGISIDHFTGKRHLLGKKSLNRKPWNEVLVIKKNKSKREDAYRLRRALIESGREYKCSKCGSNSIWQNKELRLQVDHIDGNRFDNRPRNIRFLCPNCHSQTDNFCKSQGLTDIDNIRKYYMKRRNNYIPQYTIPED